MGLADKIREQQQAGYGQPPAGYGHPATVAPPAVGPPAVAGGLPADFNPAECPIYQRLLACVRENRLHNLYPEHALQQLAVHLRKLTPQVSALAQKWRLGGTVMFDLYKLSLYDVIMLCDDSGSMRLSEHGARIEDLKTAVGYIAECASIFDLDGIGVRFLNSDLQSDNITSQASAAALIEKVKFSGWTPLGTALNEKILKPFFFDRLRQNKLTKPLLVIVVTDGEPAGEPEGTLENVIKAALTNREHFGHLVAFQFAQVGTDMASQRFLASLDSHPVIGSAIDVTSNYEMEGAELQKKGLELSPELYIAKMMLGSIDSTYDALDE